MSTAMAPLAKRVARKVLGEGGRLQQGRQRGTHVFRCTTRTRAFSHSSLPWQP